MMRARRSWALTIVGLVVVTTMSCWTSFSTAQSKDDRRSAIRTPHIQLRRDNGPTTAENNAGDRSESSSSEESSQVASVSTQVGTTDIARCIRNLASAKFDDRQSAHESLVRAGSLAIDALEKAARTKKLESATRCVEILHQIASEKKNEAAAIAALERLAKHSSSRATSLAAQTVIDFRTTDEERAIAALIRDGVRINRSLRGQIFSVNVVHDGQVALLKHLSGLRYVNASGKGITNASVDGLAEMKKLTNLTMMSCSVTDAGLKKMKALTHLASLSLYSQRNMITREGLRHLKRKYSPKGW
jgi:hypothetical protein